MKKVYIDPNTGRTKVKTINTEASRTQQQFKEQCSYQNIMDRYVKTGQLTHLRHNRDQGVYTELSSQIQFQDAMNIVTEATSAFASLPSYIRHRFHNDPSQMLAFLEDPNNYDEGVKLGLYDAKKVELIQNTNSNDDKKTQNTNDDKKTKLKKSTVNPASESEE